MFSKRRMLIVLLALIILGGFVSVKLGFFDLIRSKAAEEKISSSLTQLQDNSSLTKSTKTLGQSKVSIVQSEKSSAKDLKYEDIRTMVFKAVELSGEFSDLVKDNYTVVIKPNLVGTKDFLLPNWQGNPLPQEVNGVTTDWRVTKAVVELVRKYDPHGKVYVMEGSATGSTKDNMSYFNYTPENIPGVDEFIAIEEDSGAWHDYNSKGIEKVELPNGLLHKEYYLNKKYKEADVVISVPCLKDHWNAAVSGGIKNVGIGATPANIYGIAMDNHGRNNMVEHDTQTGDIHKWIHDFYMCRPVDYVIMDSLQGIQNGPTPSYEMSGSTKLSQDQMNMRMIVAGRDPIAVDTIESLLMEWDPQTVGYLKYLSADKAGNLDTAKITVLGKQVDAVRKNFKGVLPISGGSKFTDTTAPKLTVKKSIMKNGELNISLTVDKKTKKAEIYLDGKLCDPIITNNFDNIILNPGKVSAGKHKVKICTYDRFLNHSEKTVDVSSDGKTKAKNIILDGTLYEAPKAAKAPVIDGISNDTCWANAPWADIKYLWLGKQPTPENFSGRYKIVWTPEKLYYLVEITDDILSDTHPNPLVDYYKDDTLEIFLDEDHSGGDHANNYNAVAYHIAKDYNVVDLDTKGNPRLFNNNLTMKRTDKGSLHTWEIAVNVYNDQYDENSNSNTPVTLNASKNMGYALAYCDNDGGNDRDAFLGSIDIPGTDKNIAWSNADVFGTLKLLP